MSKTPPAAGRAFVFRLDPHSGVPVYRQLMDQITGGMASGALAPGEQLPTVRQMAADLAINPNTVRARGGSSRYGACWKLSRGQGRLSEGQKRGGMKWNGGGSWRNW